MSLQIFHILVNVYDFLSVMIHLCHEGLNCLGEIRELLLNDSFIFLEMLLYMGKELLEVLLIIQNKLVDDSFVKLIAWELIGISFYND